MILVGSFVCIWPAAALAKMPVFVSILPQRYFVEQIGGAACGGSGYGVAGG